MENATTQSSIKVPPRPTILKPKTQKGKQIKSPLQSPHFHTNQLHDNAARRNEARQQLNQEQKRISVEEQFDEFMDQALISPFNEAFEPQLRNMFSSEKAVLWVDRPESHSLFTPTYQIVAEYNNSLPGFIFKTKSVIQVRDPNQAPGGFLSDPRIASPMAPQLFFPLIANGITRGIVQIVKRNSAGGFTDTDMSTVSLIMRKFAIYGDYLFSSQNLSKIALSFFSADSSTRNPLEMLQKHFHSKTVELWHFDISKLCGQKFDPIRGEVCGATISESGIVGESIKTQNTMNVAEAKDSDLFVEEIDGTMDGPVLAVPYYSSKREGWAIVLRGRSKPFSTNDESQLVALLPFVVRSVNGFSTDHSPSFLLSQLSDLLSAVVAISSTLELVDLVRVVEEQMVNLVRCHSCKLFLVENQQIIRSFGKMDEKKFSSSMGIVGHVAETPSLMTIDNEKSVDFFFSEMDGDTFPMIVAPVFENCKKVRAVLLLAGKSGTIGNFDEDDEKTLTAMAVFTGLALENTRLRKSVTVLAQMIREFMLKVNHTNDEEEIIPILDAIFTTSLTVLHATRICLYRPNSIFLSCGSEPDQENFIIKEKIIKEMEASPDEIEYQAKQISPIFTNDEFDVPIIPKTIREVSTPLFDNSDEYLGRLEIRLFLTDLEIIDTLTEIGRTALLRTRKPLQLEGLIGSDELAKHEIPKKLNIADDLTVLNFDIWKFDVQGLYSICFKVFNELGLMDSFDISNVRLFHFLTSVQSCYHEIKTHNFRSVISHLHYVFRVLRLFKLDKILEKTEILCLVTATLCHYLDHDGYAQLSQSQAQSPIQILFEREHLMETQACTICFEILLHEENNILSNAAETIWTNLRDLILSTNVSRTSEIDELQKLMKEGMFNPIQEPNHRLLIMKNVLRASIISPLLRGASPGVVALDFFAENPQGKQKVIAVFLDSYCLPLFKCLSYAIPLLKTDYQQLTELSK